MEEVQDGAAALAVVAEESALEVHFERGPQIEDGGGAFVALPEDATARKGWHGRVLEPALEEAGRGAVV